MSPYMIIFIVNDDNYVLLGGNSWQLLGIGKNSMIFCGSALRRMPLSYVEPIFSRVSRHVKAKG